MSTLADVTDPRFTADQLATLAAFESAPTPPEVREAAVGKAILRAVLGDTDGGLVLGCDLPADEIARLIVEHGAVAAVAAYRATQDGGAGEAVRRVESAPGIARAAWAEGYEACRRGQQKHNPYRAALAPQAGEAGQ